VLGLFDKKPCQKRQTKLIGCCDEGECGSHGQYGHGNPIQLPSYNYYISTDIDLGEVQLNNYLLFLVVAAGLLQSKHLAWKLQPQRRRFEAQGSVCACVLRTKDSFAADIRSIWQSYLMTEGTMSSHLRKLPDKGRSRIRATLASDSSFLTSDVIAERLSWREDGAINLVLLSSKGKVQVNVWLARLLLSGG
jgi:hypothetical protein